MVKKYFLHILFFILSNSLLAQNFEHVDKIALSYTKKFSSPKQLADQISKDFKTDIEQVRAIYTWMAYHIEYDIQESSFPSYSYSSEKDRVTKERKYAIRLSKRVMTKRKAVCQGYSYLFKEICNALDIKATIATGASKTIPRDIGRRYNSDHAWNVVTIDNRNYLIDVTWAAQLDESRKAYINYYYFMTAPELFILNHYPDSYSNALLDIKIPRQEFLENPLFYDYAPSEIRLIKPSKGMLPKGKKHSFKFDVVEPVTWVEVIIGKELLKINDYIYQNGILTFDVGIPNYNRARDLIIYINGTPIVSYAIK